MITNLIYKDGFGENFKFIIYSILFAEYSGECFHYTYLTDDIEHNYFNDINYTKKIEKVINISNNYTSADSTMNLYEAPGKFFLYHFFENNIDFCLQSKCLRNLKKIFRDANKNNFDKSFFNIAIHIRRINIHDNKILHLRKTPIPGTDISNDVYIDIIKKLKHTYKNYKIHIYSQGDKKDFNFDNDVVLHLNENIEDTFTDLVYADLLVIAPSSFSYSAALLSDGIIYYTKSYHTPLPGWTMVENYRNKDHEMYPFNVKGLKEDIYFDAKNFRFYIEKDDSKIEYINIEEYLNPNKIK